MKKLETQKGITLVALIITIVVLLILAVVAIGAVKDSDIIGYSKNAAGSYEEKKGEEENTLENYANTIGIYIPKETVDSYTFRLSDILQLGESDSEISCMMPVDKFWSEDVSENLKNNAFDTTGYWDEEETRFASNFVCSDSRFANPFAYGGSQDWDEDTSCYIAFYEEMNVIAFLVQINDQTIHVNNYKELGFENLTFTISVPKK